MYKTDQSTCGHSAKTCTCGRPVAVHAAGAWRVAARHCGQCLARIDEAADAERLVADRVERRRIARLDDPRRAGWSIASYPTDAEAVRAGAAGRAWLADAHAAGRNLLITGPVGAGKTGLAWGLLGELVDAGQRGLFMNARDLLAELRASYRDGARPALFERAMKTATLVLDDLGAERPTAWAVEQIARLIDARYTALLPTIVTSNSGPDALLRHLAVDDDVASGQRIVSRLCEDAIRIRLDSPDRRRDAQRLRAVVG